MDFQPVSQTVGASKRSFFSWRLWAAGALLAGAAAIGCEGEPPAAPPSKPTVEVSNPIPDSVADFEVFTGRTQAMHYVDIKARVTGELMEMNFKEGEDVKKGQTLFKIDARPYDATLARPTRWSTRRTRTARVCRTSIRAICGRRPPRRKPR